MFRDANTNGKTLRRNNKVVSIKDNIVVNAREEGGTYRELLEFGNVLFLALSGNYLGVQIAVVLSAVFSHPGPFTANQDEEMRFFPSKFMMEPHRAKFDHWYLEIPTSLA